MILLPPVSKVLPPISGGSTLNSENFGYPRTPPRIGFATPQFGGEQPGEVATPSHFLLPPKPGGAWGCSPPFRGGPGNPKFVCVDVPPHGTK